MFISVGTRHIPVGSVREIRELPDGEVEIHRADSAETHRLAGDFARRAMESVGITPVMPAPKSVKEAAKAVKKAKTAVEEAKEPGGGGSGETSEPGDESNSAEETAPETKSETETEKKPRKRSRKKKASETE